MALLPMLLIAYHVLVTLQHLIRNYNSESKATTSNALGIFCVRPLDGKTRSRSLYDSRY